MPTDTHPSRFVTLNDLTDVTIFRVLWLTLHVLFRYFYNSLLGASKTIWVVEVWKWISVSR